MPIRIEQHDAVRQAIRATVGNPLFHLGLRLRGHAVLQFATLGIDRRQPLGKFVRTALIIGKQAFDAQRHVFKAPCRIDARTNRKSQIAGDHARRITFSGCEQSGNSGTGATGADTLHPGFDEDAVVAIQRHEVGDRAERDQIEQSRKIRFGTA